MKERFGLMFQQHFYLPCEGRHASRTSSVYGLGKMNQAPYLYDDRPQGRKFSPETVANITLYGPASPCELLHPSRPHLIRLKPSQ